MAAAKRFSFHIGLEIALRTGVPYVYHTEAEKPFMINQLEAMDEDFEVTGADVLVATRSVSSWKTWVPYQQKTEREANANYAHALGWDDQIDIMHGPGGFRVQTASYAFLDGGRYCGAGIRPTYAQHYAAVVAFMDGLKVMPSRPLNVHYPNSQYERELGGELDQKRRDQRDQLSEDVVKLRDFLISSTVPTQEDCYRLWLYLKGGERFETLKTINQPLHFIDGQRGMAIATAEAIIPNMVRAYCRPYHGVEAYQGCFVSLRSRTDAAIWSWSVSPEGEIESSYKEYGP
jgi:hypothetical protein